MIHRQTILTLSAVLLAGTLHAADVQMKLERALKGFACRSQETIAANGRNMLKWERYD